MTDLVINLGNPTEEDIEHVKVAMAKAVVLTNARTTFDFDKGLVTIVTLIIMAKPVMNLGDATPPISASDIARALNDFFWRSKKSRLAIFMRELPMEIDGQHYTPPPIVSDGEQTTRINEQQLPLIADHEGEGQESEGTAGLTGSTVAIKANRNVREIRVYGFNWRQGKMQAESTEIQLDELVHAVKEPCTVETEILMSPKGKPRHVVTRHGRHQLSKFLQLMSKRLEV